VANIGQRDVLCALVAGRRRVVPDNQALGATVTELPKKTTLAFDEANSTTSFNQISAIIPPLRMSIIINNDNNKHHYGTRRTCESTSRTRFRLPLNDDLYILAVDTAPSTPFLTSMMSLCHTTLCCTLCIVLVILPCESMPTAL
jgi:hypothetical protein